MSDDDHGLPADVGAALARHGIVPTLDAVLRAVTDRGWSFQLGVRYAAVEAPIPSGPR